VDVSREACRVGGAVKSWRWRDLMGWRRDLGYVLYFRFYKKYSTGIQKIIALSIVTL
jgi:hypothetical protein